MKKALLTLFAIACSDSEEAALQMLQSLNKSPK